MILVGCEESQTITAAFRKAGYEAMSCDLLPTRGNTDRHIQADIMGVVQSRRWDLIILHPDCTAMAVSGNRWYGKGMPCYSTRQYAIEWTLSLWNLATTHGVRVALENPVSVIFKYLPNVHYVQPWQFGHGETKKTGFALHNLPPLQPTNIVSGRQTMLTKLIEKMKNKCANAREVGTGLHTENKQAGIFAVEDIEALIKENEKQRDGLEMILKCAGAPNPVGALHTVISIAKQALAGGEVEK
ncbi:hypothetical protein M0R72_13840 [Candidatus Pacearchaeota archaeon]|nr:hypothetical protein [Candidatus Pacearchaeota archaeon]